jgi:hypothetical protein
VANTNRSGAWSKKMEIYKNAFDNELYGQDYRSEDSYSTIVPVAYNYLFAGTYEAVMDFYDNHAVKSGLASRTQSPSPTVRLRFTSLSPLSASVPATR